MKNCIRNILFYCVAGIICGLFLLLMLRAYTYVDKQASGKLSQEIKPIIVLDPGHGGEDGGASSKSGILEKDINLSVAKHLRDLLTVSGFQVVMTRETDISIYDSSADTVREKKVSDLHNRLQIINAYPQSVFISIHQNNFSESKYCGAQMFYSQNNPKSKQLAEYCKQAFVSLLQPNNTRECKPADSTIYLLWNSQNPSLLVECGFLSNVQEAGLLNDEAYQKKVAFCVYCGFMEYWRNNE